jgi:dTMP kinase
MNLSFAFDGADYCGKSTQIKLLSKYLISQGLTPEICREPGGTAIGELLRYALKHPNKLYPILNNSLTDFEDFQELPINEKTEPITEMLMFITSRAQFIATTVRRILNEGKIPLRDRSEVATKAYQGYGLFNANPLVLDVIDSCHKLIYTLYPKTQPTLTFILDLPFEVMQKRIEQSGVEKDEIEKREEEFHRKVLEGYRTIVNENPKKMILINANRTENEIHQEIISHINHLL